VNNPKEKDAYDELCFYTLAHARQDPTFIHQHVVDAYAAQSADAESKPIKIAFALLGLYLQIEKGFSGAQVQRAHMQLGRKKQEWPAFALPAERGELTAVDVLAAPPGADRDRAIHAWCASIWKAFADSRPAVIGFANRLDFDQLRP
jgi:hypothetical protein